MMKNLILAGTLFLGLTVSAADAPSKGGSPKMFNVRELGAKGDGATLDTAAIQKALDQCGTAGGGTVKIPAGTYLCQPLTLRTKTTLLLEEGATLRASTNHADFMKVPGDWLKAKSGGDFIPLITGKDLTDVTFAGKGTIDGNGAVWWEEAEKARQKVSGYTLPRPNLVTLNRCKNVRMTGIRLINSPKFHFVPSECEDVVIDGVTILAPAGAANTDAIDPSNCRNVIITRCLIDVGDDNIAIKSGKKVEGREFGCENITITDCDFLHGHGMSIGSETVGGVRNVVVRNCRFNGTENGIRIKSRRERGGVVDGLICENITMTNVYPALSIACYYQNSSQALFPKDDKAQPVTETTPLFRNIRISNLTAYSTRNAGLIVGLPESLVSNVVLENVQITAKTGLTIANAKGVQLKNVKIKTEKGEPVILDNAQVEGMPVDAIRTGP
jgi:polygalacturonase